MFQEEHKTPQIYFDPALHFRAPAISSSIMTRLREEVPYNQTFKDSYTLSTRK